ncbi:MAG TPA: N-acetyl-gamma-glutamyl-phosphate reductase [Opitutales bacterium]|nr:N-acetyl-gamma-glutamyl-phosphate reductase [Opitutales bacterium]
MKVGIIGASGYSGELLVKLLARHPFAKLTRVTSRQLGGKAVAEVMPFMRGQLGGLAFSNSDPAEVAASEEGIYFLALPHGVAAEYAKPLVAAGKTVIDLSADFRLNSTAVYKDYYGAEHPAPELLAAAPYVQPELRRMLGDSSWKKAKLIACPGCYPTSILVPLAPLMKAGVVEKNGIVINSNSGVSGAGKKATADYSYCERDASASAYGAPRHRHLSEIEEQLSLYAGSDTVVQFTPHLAPMRYGIETTIVAKAAKGLDELYAAWNAAYPKDTTPFVSVLPTGTFPETRFVVGTNRADVSAVFDKRTGNFVITSCIDNLWKGASGQAVQIMNILSGWDETAGLL